MTEFEKVEIEKCQCGASICNRYGLNDGTFYQGCGWDKETAERHAACWNACRDLPTALLKSLEHGLIPVNETAASYKARAEEAIRLLTGLAKRHEGYEEGMGPCICEWHEKTRAFLNNMKEK